MNNVTRLSTSPQPLPESWIEKMFDKMLLDYGKKFTDQWGGADTDRLITHWANEMASYSGAEIKRGLAAMEGRDWPPTLPEFKKMCRPAVDHTVAYYEAVNGCHARDRGEMGQWTHPAIYWAAVKMAFELKGQTYTAVRSRWERELQEEMGKGMWPDIPKPMLALPDIGKSPLSKEKATQMLSELGASGVFKKPENKVGNRNWAHKILERAKAGDKYLTITVINMAKEALAA